MNKRKLSGSVKKFIIIFSALVVVVAGILGVVAFTTMSSASEKLIVNSDCVAYNDVGTRIILDSSATISKSWTGEWILKDSKSQIHNLGKNTAVFDDNVLKILGGGYQIISESEINELSEFSELSNLSDSGFFKLADRTYLMTGSKIGGDNNPISTSKYVLVVMDKTGNALLLNDETCVKTKSATILDGTGYRFDIANEELIFGEDNTVDCKKIIGSSNEYDPDTDVDILRAKAEKYAENGYTKNPEEIVLDLSGGDGGDGGIGGFGGNGGTGGTGADGGIGGTGGNGGVGGQGGDGGIGKVPEVTDARKTMNLYGVTANYTSAIIRYNVNDPYGQLGDPYFNIYRQNPNTSNYDHIRTEYVDIDGSELVIFDLLPNTKYKIDFCQNMGATQSVVTSQFFTTKTANLNLTVEEVDQEYMTCRVSYVEGLTFTGATLNIVDKVAGSTAGWSSTPFASAVVPISASSIDGVVIKFDKNNGWKNMDTKNNQIKLYFSNVTFGGQVISLTNEYIINNPFTGKVAWDTFAGEYSGMFVYTYNPYAMGINRTNADAANVPAIKACITEYRNRFGQDGRCERNYWDSTDLIHTLAHIVKEVFDETYDVSWLQDY